MIEGKDYFVCVSSKKLVQTIKSSFSSLKEIEKGNLKYVIDKSCYSLFPISICNELQIVIECEKNETHSFETLSLKSSSKNRSFSLWTKNNHSRLSVHTLIDTYLI